TARAGPLPARLCPLSAAATTLISWLPEQLVAATGGSGGLAVGGDGVTVLAEPPPPQADSSTQAAERATALTLRITGRL
ncbi:MAG: hypothetical protein AAGA33_13790, partial [Pseudomonadota bacterium]